ncbi:MAG: MTAP family purine nucleoside phosphorylase, partial [Solirubrobacteraceae bacterium]
MPVGIITGSGTHALPGFEVAAALTVDTRFGAAEVSRGTLAGTEILHVSRHGAGHARLSNHVGHRANIGALHELGAGAVLAATVCGA